MQINFNRNIQKKVFRQGSITYYFSSLFFPKEVRVHVFNLYAFVRIIDNFVDQIPQKKESFYTFKKKTLYALETGLPSDDPIIDAFIKTAHDKKFRKEWIEAFFNAMESDLQSKSYKTYQDLCTYMYGSAEVIGLMMARILDLPKESYPFARKLGEAMQFVNFIRDIKEDIMLGRMYIPISDLNKFKISENEFKQGLWNKNMDRLIRYEIERYMGKQNEAEKGYKFIPKKYLVPIKTAANLYKWTARRLKKNPRIVFTKKVKPSRFHVLSTGIVTKITA